MTSKTETAILAFVAALKTAATAQPNVLSLPTRNRDVISRLAEATDGSGLELYLNVIDGAPSQPIEELLGADLSNAESFDLAWRVRVEWAVAAGSDDARHAAFDAGRSAIWNALKPAIVSGSPVYLGGAADGIRLTDFVPHDKSNAAGLPGVLACEFEFELTYTSTDPF